MPTLIRVTDTYSISNGLERAQTTHWIASASALPLSDALALVNGQIAARWGVQKNLHHTGNTWLRCRLDTVNPATGKTISGQDATLPAGTAGLNANEQLPPECAEVLSLRTLFSGPSFRGRMYMPCFTRGCLNADGSLKSADATTLVGAWKTYFTAIVAGVGDWEPVVYSRLTTSYTPLYSIDMGSIIDVQRSRRKSLIESRVSSVI